MSGRVGGSARTVQHCYWVGKYRNTVCILGRAAPEHHVDSLHTLGPPRYPHQHLCVHTPLSAYAHPRSDVRTPRLSVSAHHA
eukprot:2863244-Rhodomonas_salina.4